LCATGGEEGRFAGEKRGGKQSTFTLNDLIEREGEGREPASKDVSKKETSILLAYGRKKKSAFTTKKKKDALAGDIVHR